MKAQPELDALLGSQAREEKVLVGKTAYSFQTLPGLLDLSEIKDWSRTEDQIVKTIVAGVSGNAKNDILRTEIGVTGQPKLQNPQEDRTEKQRQIEKLIALGEALIKAAGKQYLTNAHIGILLELFSQVLDAQPTTIECYALDQNLGLSLSPDSKYRVKASQSRTVEFSFEKGKAIVTIKNLVRIQNPVEFRTEGDCLGDETLKEAETIQTITLDLRAPLSAVDLVTVEVKRGPYRDVPLSLVL